MDRHEDDPSGRVLAKDGGRGRDPVEARHRDVADDHVGRQSLGGADERETVLHLRRPRRTPARADRAAVRRFPGGRRRAAGAGEPWPFRVMARVYGGASGAVAENVRMRRRRKLRCGVRKTTETLTCTSRQAWAPSLGDQPMLDRVPHELRGMDTPRICIIWYLCVSTVRVDRLRAAAISFMRRPSRIRRSTSRCRAVSCGSA